MVHGDRRQGDLWQGWALWRQIDGCASSPDRVNCGARHGLRNLVGEQLCKRPRACALPSQRWTHLQSRMAEASVSMGRWARIHQAPPCSPDVPAGAGPPAPARGRPQNCRMTGPLRERGSRSAFIVPLDYGERGSPGPAPGMGRVWPSWRSRDDRCGDCRAIPVPPDQIERVMWRFPLARPEAPHYPDGRGDSCYASASGRRRFSRERLTETQSMASRYQMSINSALYAVSRCRHSRGRQRCIFHRVANQRRMG